MNDDKSTNKDLLFLYSLTWYERRTELDSRIFTSERCKATYKRRYERRELSRKLTLVTLTTDEVTLDYVPLGRFVIMIPFEVLIRLYRRRMIALTDELIKIKPGRTKLRTNETNEPKTRTNLVSYGRD